MQPIPLAPDAVRWQPLAPPVDPAACAQPQVAALAAYWRRVRAAFTNRDPSFEARIEERARAAVGLAVEADEALRQPLSVPMFQALHVLATRDQTAARAITADGGFKYVPFPYGRLKDKPNHLTSHGRVVREFCPPADVVSELNRLIAAHDAIPEALPDVRAAWLVHAFLGIHPFVDGNGRTSRLLASHAFLRVGLPPMWGELTERGPGWRDTLDRVARCDDLFELTALFAAHEERLVVRLLSEAEAPPPDLDVDAILRHDEALATLRATWSDASESTAASIPSMITIAAACLRDVGERLDRAAMVTSASGVAGVRAAWETCGEAGVIPDRRGHGAAASLDLPTRQVTVRVAVGHLGTSGSGAVIAAMSIRPRAPVVAPIPPLLLLPEEREDARLARFERWLDRAIPDAVASIVRLG